MKTLAVCVLGILTYSTPFLFSIRPPLSDALCSPVNYSVVALSILYCSITFVTLFIELIFYSDGSKAKTKLRRKRSTVKQKWTAAVIAYCEKNSLHPDLFDKTDQTMVFPWTCGDSTY